MLIKAPMIVEKVWGQEHIIDNREQYCGKILVLKKDHACSLHYHVKKTETFYILSGECLMEYGTDELNMNSGRMIVGMGLLIKPYTFHRFAGIAKETRILEISSQDFIDDSYRVMNCHSCHVKNGSSNWKYQSLMKEDQFEE